MPNLRMRQAQPEDTAVVTELVTEVCAWLAACGIEQWPSPPGPEVLRLLVLEIAGGEVYLAYPSDAGVIGMLRFEWHDAELCPHDPAGGGYVHILLVHPGHHGRPIGASMLGWAAE
jgi:GNAT superfamily N-acetyltransferase